MTKNEFDTKYQSEGLFEELVLHGVYDRMRNTVMPDLLEKINKAPKQGKRRAKYVESYNKCASIVNDINAVLGRKTRYGILN